jgi:hypothetical protein
MMILVRLVTSPLRGRVESMLGCQVNEATPLTLDVPSGMGVERLHLVGAAQWTIQTSPPTPGPSGNPAGWKLYAGEALPNQEDPSRRISSMNCFSCYRGRDFVLLVVLFLHPFCAVAAELTDAPTHNHEAPKTIRDGASHGHAEAIRGDRSYSLMMHHTIGYAVLTIGFLTLMDRITSYRYALLRIGIGALWTVMGLFIFVRADPEGWPMGAAGLMESWTMPTAGEWLQHKILSFIPVFIGSYTILSRGPAITPTRSLILGCVAILGVIGLLSHQHHDHPGMDIVNLQHRWFALTALLTAVSFVLEARKGWT